MPEECNAYSRDRNRIQILADNPEGKRPHGRPKNKWEQYSNGSEIKRLEGRRLDSGLRKQDLVDRVMDLRILRKVGTLNSRETFSFLRTTLRRYQA